MISKTAIQSVLACEHRLRYRGERAFQNLLQGPYASPLQYLESSFTAPQPFSVAGTDSYGWRSASASARELGLPRSSCLMLFARLVPESREAPLALWKCVQDRERDSLLRNPVPATCDWGTFRPARGLQKKETTQKEAKWRRQMGVSARNSK